MPHQTEVNLPNDQEIEVTRTFDAPRALVFDCHTVPRLVQRWLLGPPGWSMPVCEIDLRVGGRYRYRWRNDEDGSEFGFRGEYREIAVPERIVHTERFDDGDDAEQGEMLSTLLLTEEDGRTTLTQKMRFADKEARDQALATGMTDGMAKSYDRLEQMLEEQPVS